MPLSTLSLDCGPGPPGICRVVSSDSNTATSVPSPMSPWLHTVTWTVRGWPGRTLAGPFTAVTTKSGPFCCAWRAAPSPSSGDSPRSHPITATRDSSPSPFHILDVLIVDLPLVSTRIKLAYPVFHF